MYCIVIFYITYDDDGNVSNNNNIDSKTQQ